MDEEELNRVDSVLCKKLESMRDKPEKMGIRLEMRGDDGYDARYVFSLLASLGITPIICIRTSANARSNGVGRARALAALEQFGGVGGCSNEEFNHTTKAEIQLKSKEMEKGGQVQAAMDHLDGDIGLQACIWRVGEGPRAAHCNHRDRHQSSRLQPQSGHTRCGRWGNAPPARHRAAYDRLAVVGGDHRVRHNRDYS